MQSFLASFTPSTNSRRAAVSYGQKYAHLVLVNCTGCLSLPKNSVLGLNDRPDMSIAVYRGCKAVKTYIPASL